MSSAPDEHRLVAALRVAVEERDAEKRKNRLLDAILRGRLFREDDPGPLAAGDRMPVPLAFACRMFQDALDSKPEAENFIGFGWTDEATGASYHLRVSHGSNGREPEAVAAALREERDELLAVRDAVEATCHLAAIPGRVHDGSAHRDPAAEERACAQVSRTPDDVAAIRKRSGVAQYVEYMGAELLAVRKERDELLATLANERWAGHECLVYVCSTCRWTASAPCADAKPDLGPADIAADIERRRIP